MIRHIYTKIFLWFWVAMVVVSASVVLFAAITGTQPLGRRWMIRTIDYYGNAAVDFYASGGKPALQKYLNDIEQNSGIRATLFDPDSVDILRRGVPPLQANVLERTRETGKPQFHIGLRWTGTSLICRPEGTYILLAQVRPLRGVLTPQTAAAFVVRIVIALLVAGLLCLLLARHIAAPIRTLQTAAGRIANGDLSVRAVPSIAPRNDELADLAQDFDRMAEQVQALLRKQQELLGDISHELRSPLARLGVSLELVRRGEMDGVERMQTDLDLLEHLIGQILTLTRLQTQQHQRPETTVDLRSVVEGVAEDARFEGKESQKSVTISHAHDCWIKGDAGLLRSCIENVVRNAVRYTKPSSTVDISLDIPKGSVTRFARIVIRDSGPGVPAEALPRLFEPFYRVSLSRDRNTGGTGLGLSIAQRIVVFHGGTIAARNRPEGGLETEIRLPLSN